MNWVLVYVLVISGSAHAEIEGRFQSLSECFEGKEALAIIKGGGAPGYFPQGSQALCVYAINEEE